MESRSAEKLAPPWWPSFMASPTLHHPVSESKSDLVSTSRAGVITQIVEAVVALIAKAERGSAGSLKLWRKRPQAVFIGTHTAGAVERT